jgi:putative hydrolase of the HAD superfamily
MIKKALIFDLDDTIYATKSVVEDMYKELYTFLEGQVDADIISNIKEDIKTTPFHVIADRYSLEKKLKDQGIKICLDMDYNGSMQPFADYEFTKKNAAERFLVTAGYTKLQKGKIRQLGIGNDFKELFIPDPYTSELTKTDVFRHILTAYNYKPSEVLVVGDNPETEIAAGKELGIETYLYDYEGKYSPALAEYYGTSYHNFNEIAIIQ